MPQLERPGMNIEGLRACFPLYNHLLNEPRSICIHPCILPPSWASFQLPLSLQLLLQPKTNTSPHLSLFDTFFKSCGFPPPE